MMTKSGLCGSAAIFALTFGFIAPAAAQVNTGGSNFYRAGVPSEGRVLYNRGRSGEFGRNNPWVPGSEMAPIRRGRPMYGQQMRPVYGQSRPMMVRRSYGYGSSGAAIVAGGGSVRYVVRGGGNNVVELERGANYAAAQPVPLTPGPTRHAIKSPYENLGSKDGTTYFAVPVD